MSIWRVQLSPTSMCNTRPGQHSELWCTSTCYASRSPFEQETKQQCCQTPIFQCVHSIQELASSYWVIVWWSKHGEKKNGSYRIVITCCVVWSLVMWGKSGSHDGSLLKGWCSIMQANFKIRVKYRSRLLHCWYFAVDICIFTGISPAG